MKYIVVQTAGLEQPILFNDMINHSDMAAAVGDGFNVLSAGFVRIRNDMAECFGESVTLGIASRGEWDADLVNASLLATVAA